MTNPLQFIRTWFKVDTPFDDIIDQQRARALTIITALVAGLPLLLTVTLLVLFPDSLLIISVITNLALAMIAIFARYLLSQGQLRQAASILVLIVLVGLTVQFLPWGLQPEVSVLFSLPIVLAAVLLEPRATVFTTILSMVGVFVIILPGYPDNVTVLGGGIPDADAVNATLVTMYVGMITVAGATIALTNQLRAVARASQRVTRRLEAAAVVSEVASTQPRLAELLTTVVERIREAYDFYHAQVFLLDEEGRMARLEASTGRAGEALLARGHALPVGSQSVVGRCTNERRAIVVNDTELSATHRPNPLLPRTRAELALPLIVGDEVIGAIDVQSVEPNIFQPDDIRSLQVMAGQLAASISQARLIDELQDSARENRTLLEEAQNSLRQIEELNRRLTREGWTDYLRARRRHGTLGFTLQGPMIVDDDSWSAPMRQAFQAEQSVIIRQDTNKNIAAVPIRVRGEVIGVLELERAEGQPWTDDEIEMAETLVERIGIAVENARLYEQATMSVQREQNISRIGQQVLGSDSVEDVLRTALDELGGLLKAESGMVRIAPREDNPQ